MKFLACFVAIGFMILGAFIPSMAKAGSETGVQPLALIQASQPIKAAATPLDSVQGVYLLQGASWHSGCQSQLELVHQAADAMGMGDDWYYMQQIFSRESCVDPGRVNSIGAAGLGQSLGHSSFTCGPGDIPCQLTWFNIYSVGAYGSWANAWSAWQQKQWW